MAGRGRVGLRLQTTLIQSLITETNSLTSGAQPEPRKRTPQNEQRHQEHPSHRLRGCGKKPFETTRAWRIHASTHIEEGG